MNDTVKKTLLVGVIVIAAGFAGYQAYRMMAGEPLQQGVNMPHKGKSMKQMEMEAMGPAPGGTSKGEPDLSGGPTPKGN